MTTSSNADNLSRNHQRKLHALASTIMTTVVGLDKSSRTRLFARWKEFTEYLLAGTKRFSAKTPDYDTARSILGIDFVTPEEIMVVRPSVVYTDQDIQQRAATIPSAEVLNWCKANNHALIAGPATPLSLLDVRALQTDHFYSKKDGWYAEPKQVFSRNDKATLGWLIIRKDPVPGSLNKNWAEQAALLSDASTYVPIAGEMTWFITTYFLVRGVRLFPNVYVRTSSLDSDGGRVGVGGFDAEGLGVFSDWDGIRYSFLGLSSARKF